MWWFVLDIPDNLMELLWSYSHRIHWISSNGLVVSLKTVLVVWWFLEDLLQGCDEQNPIPQISWSLFLRSAGCGLNSRRHPVMPTSLPPGLRWMLFDTQLYIWRMNEINGGYGRKMIRKSTRPNIPKIIIIIIINSPDFWVFAHRNPPSVFAIFFSLSRSLIAFSCPT